jgi:AcrR family transcriptional regulator
LAARVKEVDRHSSQRSIDAIVAAAATEFAAHGVDGARMEVIARRAKVTKQLLYHYYGSKKALYIAVLEHFANISVTEIAVHDYESLEPTLAFQFFVNSIFDLYRRFPNLAAFMVDQNLHHAAHVTARNKTRAQVQAQVKTLDRILRRGAQAGVFRADMNAAFLHGATVTVVLACFSNSNTLSMCLNSKLDTPEVLECWRKYSVDLLLSSLRRNDRP